MLLITFIATHNSPTSNKRLYRVEDSLLFNYDLIGFMGYVITLRTLSLALESFSWRDRLRTERLWWRLVERPSWRPPPPSLPSLRPDISECPLGDRGDTEDTFNTGKTVREGLTQKGILFEECGISSVTVCVCVCVCARACARSHMHPLPLYRWENLRRL